MRISLPDTPSAFLSHSFNTAQRQFEAICHRNPRYARGGCHVLKGINESGHIHLKVAYFCTVVLMRKRHPACWHMWYIGVGIFNVE